MTILSGNFYKNKKIMITGHTGFVGSWLSKSLSILRADLCGYSIGLPTEPSMYETLGIGKDILDIRGDIRDKESLAKAILDFGPEVIFHLAAQPIVLNSFDNPIETFDVNVMGTANLLDILRTIDSVRVILVMTSDKVYRNNESMHPYKEEDPLGGRDPYSASKSSQDIVVNSFRESYFADAGIGVSSVRAGNIIGGGDWGKFRIVPDIVRGIIANQTVEIRNPASTRPWQYILDPIFGMLLLSEKMWANLKFSGEWNFGPDFQEVTTVEELASKFIKYWGKGRLNTIGKVKNKEANMLRLDTSKAISKLGWRSRYSTEETIKKTVEWYKEWYTNQNGAIDLTERQIRINVEGEYDHDIA